MLDAQSKNHFKGCLVNNMMSELSSINDLVAEATASKFEVFLKVVEPTVREAQQNGDFSTSQSAELLTEIIHTTFFGLLTRSKGTKMNKHEIMHAFLNSLKK